MPPGIVVRVEQLILLIVVELIIYYSLIIWEIKRINRGKMHKSEGVELVLPLISIGIFGWAVKPLFHLSASWDFSALITY